MTVLCCHVHGEKRRYIAVSELGNPRKTPV